MTTKFKGVAIGAGYFSHYQYEAWNRIPEVAIAAAYNRTRSKIAEVQEKFGVPAIYSDDQLEAMLDAVKPDFADVITPPSTHLEICQLAFDRGITVICQKPLAPSYAESVKLVAAAQKSAGRFMVHENWRWQPWYRQMKKLLDDGTVGELFSLSARMRMGDGWGDDAYLSRQPFFRDYERLLIFETGVHFLDAFRYLGGEVSSIYARLARRNPVIKGEDSGLVVCQFASGATATYDANRYNEAETDDARFTFGTIRIDGSKGHLELSLSGDIVFKPLGQPARVIDYPHPRVGFAGDCVYHLQRHFTDQMISGQPFENTGEDYLKTLKLVEACYASNTRNEVIQIADYEPGE